MKISLENSGSEVSGWLSQVRGDLKLHLIIGLVLLSVTVTLLIPGIIAHLDGVLTESTMRQRLPQSNPKVTAYINQKSQSALASSLSTDISKAINSEIRGKCDPEKLEKLISAKEYYDQIASIKATIRVVGFFESTAPYYLFASFFSFSICAMMSPRNKLSDISVVNVVFYSFFAYLLWMGPNWARNFLFSTEGRAVFSHVHFDISRPCFFAQELQTFAICCLIGVSWCNWLVYYRNTLPLLQSWSVGNVSCEDLSDKALLVGGILDRWQMGSINLACGFLPWTLFYWIVSIQYGDVRYYSSALAVHLLWGISWWIISQPSLTAWATWNRYKLLLKTFQVSGKAQDDGVLQYMSDMAPLTNLRTILVGSMSVILFVLPLLNLLRR